MELSCVWQLWSGLLWPRTWHEHFPGLAGGLSCWQLWPRQACYASCLCWQRAKSAQCLCLILAMHILAMPLPG